MHRLLLLIAALFSSAAFAQSGDLAHQQCMTAAPSSDPHHVTRCFANYLARLQREQTKLLVQLRHALSVPPREGANFDEAKRQLNSAQAAWARFVTADCSMSANVFGLGSAFAVAEIDCRVKHVETRNARLKALAREL